MKNITTALLLLVMVASCMKEEVNLDNLNSDAFNPSFAIPIGTANLKIGRLNSETNNFFELNPSTGLLELTFDAPSFSYGLSDFNLVQNQSFFSSVSMGASEVAAFNSVPTGSSYSFQTSNVSSFSVPGSQQLDSVLINSGNLRFSISSNYTHSLSIVVTIPSLKSNGVSYTSTIVLNYSGTVPVTKMVNLSLAGYSLDLTDGGSNNNTIRISYNTTLTKGATPATTLESIGFNTTIEINDLEEVYGYFGNQNLTQNDTLETEIFDDILGGTVSFADPRIEMKLTNSAGISFDAKFTSITALQNTQNQNLGGPGLTSIPLIRAAAFIGDSTVTNHTINNANTIPTLTTILDEQPDQIAYATSVQMNPGGFAKNFIAKSSQIKANAKIALPLDFYGVGFKINDTSSAQLEDIIGLDSADSESLRSVTIRVVATNGLPIEAGLQVYFMDSSNVALDSLFTSGINSILMPGTVNFSVPTSDPNYGQVSSPSSKTFDVTLTKEQYQSLISNGQSKIAYHTTLKTIGGNSSKNVKVMPNNFIELKVSAKIDLKLSIN